MSLNFAVPFVKVAFLNPLLTILLRSLHAFSGHFCYWLMFARLLILFFSFVLFTEKDPDHSLPHSRYHHFSYNFIMCFIS